MSKTKYNLATHNNIKYYLALTMDIKKNMTLEFVRFITLTYTRMPRGVS